MVGIYIMLKKAHVWSTDLEIGANINRNIIIPKPRPNDVAMLTCKIQLLVIEILGT